MSSTAIFELKATLRQDKGKGASRRLRRLNDEIPAILYGGEEKPVSLTFPHKDLMKALENESFYSHILTLEIEGKKEKVVLKALQRHPYKKHRLQHLDLQRVNAKKMLTMHVPLHFEGEALSPGMQAGGMLTRQMTDVEVQCLPANLPEYIAVDLSTLPLDSVVHLSDLKTPKGVELLGLAHGDLPVATIHKSKRAAEEEPSVVDAASTGASVVASAPPEKKENKRDKGDRK